MGGNAATFREGYLEEQERILGKVGVNIATHWEGCLEEWERILGRRGGMLRHLGKVIAAIEGNCCDRLGGFLGI